MIWKCLLVDGDPNALKCIQQYIRLVEQLEVVCTCNDAFQAMTFMQTGRVDLIFLDIQLPNLPGTSFIKSLLHPPKFIFITSSPEFAVEAFELGAVDYLLKPVSIERFLIAVNKLVNMVNHGEEGHALPMIRGSLFFRTNRKMVKIFLDEITYVESIKDYIKIYTELHPPILVKQSLTSLEYILPCHLFVRIHRSFIVSINKLTAFTNNDVEIDKIEIPIGRQFLGQLKRLVAKK
ncbi:DNA-binding LytR/AlgR family response regulator [Pedobacter sp. CG_S7]|uniref:LytR/AlgR family response regulator transcription factor n=1 Tax=Pedobacter sp. CG_S7 TaxID=3143930 RepID=UPI0033994F89